MARLELMERALQNAQTAGRTSDAQALQQAIAQARAEMRPALSQAYYNAKINGNDSDAQAIVTYLQRHGMTLAPPSAQQHEALFQKQQARDVASMNPLQRYGLGYGHMANAIVQGIKQNTTDSALDALNAGGRDNRVQQDMRAVAEDRRLSQALNNTIAGKLGNLTGGIVTTAPVAAIPGLGEAGIATRVLAGGAQGAGLGYLQPYATPGEHVTNTALGGVAGAAIPAATAAGSRMLTGVATPEARRLIAQGVKPSFGQMLGGVIGRTEQAQTSLPLTGDIIQSARNQGIDTFNRAATNKVLAPIGEAIPDAPSLRQRMFGSNQAANVPRVATGQPSMAYAAGAASKAFDKALGGTRGVFDSQLGNELASIINNAPPGARSELADAIQNGVLNRFAANDGTLSGQAFNDARSDLAKAAVKYRQSESASNRDVGDSLGDVLDSLDSMFARNNGQQAMEDLAAARRAYRGTMALKDATNAAGRTREGVFTPAEFLGAVKKNDATKGKAAFSRGQAYLQDFGNDAQSALGNNIGNSFTFDRMARSVPGWALSPMGAPLALPNLPGVRGAVQSLLAPQAAPVVRSRLAGLLGQSDNKDSCRYQTRCCCCAETRYRSWVRRPRTMRCPGGGDAMNAPQTRRSPRGGAGFEIDQQIGFARQLYGDAERAARAGYRGATRLHTQPSPRDPAAIARDLHAASAHLADLAELIGAEHFDTQTLTNADALLVGAGRLIVELRQRVTP